jgi:hypothetical protein
MRHRVARLVFHDWTEHEHITRFVLECPTERRAELTELIARIEVAEDLRARILLFLRNLRRVVLRTLKIERVILRSDRDVSGQEFPALTRPQALESLSSQVRRLEVEESGRSKIDEEFLVISGQAKVPVPTATGRQLRSLQCAIAFRWDSERQRFGRPLADESQLYLFLPTKTRTGLPFLVHGEFLTNLGRTDIDGDQETNARLASAIAVLVTEVLRASFQHWRGDTEAILSVYGVVPLPSDNPRETPWLGAIRGAFARLLKDGEQVVLTARGDLMRPSECVFGSRLVQLAYRPLLAVDPTIPLRPLVSPEIQDVLQRAQAGIEYLTGPTLGESLFPNHLSRDKVISRCRTLLWVLYEQGEDRDISKLNEREQIRKKMSDLPCFPVERGGTGRLGSCGGRTSGRFSTEEEVGPTSPRSQGMIRNSRGGFWQTCGGRNRLPRSRPRLHPPTSSPAKSSSHPRTASRSGRTIFDSSLHGGLVWARGAGRPSPTRIACQGSACGRSSAWVSARKTTGQTGSAWPFVRAEPVTNRSGSACSAWPTSASLAGDTRRESSSC